MWAIHTRSKQQISNNKKYKYWPRNKHDPNHEEIQSQNQALYEL